MCVGMINIANRHPYICFHEVSDTRMCVGMINIANRHPYICFHEVSDYLEEM